MTGLSHEQRRARRLAICEDVKNGMSLKKAAAKHGVCYETVRDACTTNGVTHVNLSRNTYLVLADLLNTNLTYAEIADKREITKQRVGHVFNQAKKAGITFQNRS